MPPPGTEIFFLWGPRQAGKTTLLCTRYVECRWIDLLKADEFRRYVTNPEYLRQEILEDTLLGRWLPAYRRRPKRRVTAAPKFYLSDVGVMNRLARRGGLSRGSDAYGKAFENWVFHELSAYLDYAEAEDDLSYWRPAGGTEVDFVVGDMRVSVEAKASARIVSRHLKGLRSLTKDHQAVARRVMVCLEPRARRTEDGIDILPAEAFAEQLWEGSLG